MDTSKPTRTAGSAQESAGTDAEPRRKQEGPPVAWSLISPGLGLRHTGDTLHVEERSRRVVNVAARVSQNRLSPVWKYMVKFDPATEKGKNVVCHVMLLSGEVCGYLTTHKPSSGTGNMVRHLKDAHEEIHDKCMRASTHSSVAQQGRGSVSAGGSKPGDYHISI